MRVVVLGVFMVMLLVMPGMAEPDTPGGPGAADIDTQTPVLDGSAFTNYDTVFLHGTMAEANEASYDVFREGDVTDGHIITLNPSADYAFIECPFYSYDSKQGGIYPAVRYLGLQYKTSGEAEIPSLNVYNGPSYVKTILFTPPLKSTGGFTLKVIDLGGWIRFNRGLNMDLKLLNPSLTNTGMVKIGAYGARFEW
jgi:hypothetical protein